MARTRTPKILDQTIAETPDGPLEETPSAPEADLPNEREVTPQDSFAVISERQTVPTGFIPGKTHTYKLPTGAKRTDN